MKKSDINILVLEDDTSFLETLEGVLKGQEYKVFGFTDPKEALAELEVREFDLIVSDCMLPNMNGIDFLQKAKGTAHNEFKSILISGVFKDDNFIRDAKSKTGAIEFFVKPFDFDEFNEVVRQSFDDKLGPQIVPIYSYLTKDFSEDYGKIIEDINESGPFHGYEIPYLVSVLQSNKVTGELHFQVNHQLLSSICFHKGRIFRVNSNDTQSYFGVLLIEKGFCTPEEIARSLEGESNLPIGKRLWEANNISPHAIEIVQREQMSIRMSQIIQENTVSFAFEEKNYEEPEIFIDENSYRNFLGDWISSKVKSDWLKNIYTPWFNHPILKGPKYHLFEELKSIPILRLVPDLSGDIADKLILSEIIDKYEKKPFLLQAIHYLLLNEILKVSEEVIASKDFGSSIARIKKFKESMETRSYYQVFGIDPEAPPAKIQQAYHNFALSMHPDKVPHDAPKELLDETTEVFQKLTQIQQVLLNPASREKYDFELEHGKAEQILKSEALFEKGHTDLMNNNYAKACQTFEEIYKMNTYGNDFLVYYCWAVIKRGAPQDKREELIRTADKLLAMIPQEARHNSEYFFVKGLYLKLTGDVERAIGSFKHAFSLNPSLRAAQIEWLSLEKAQTPDNDFLGNLTGIFKKKTG